jgi:hypothetical protein
VTQQHLRALLIGCACGLIPFIACTAGTSLFARNEHKRTYDTTAIPSDWCQWQGRNPAVSCDAQTGLCLVCVETNSSTTERDYVVCKPLYPRNCVSPGKVL